jgi:outer membrane murein-binding lipoprotein Lpp
MPTIDHRKTLCTAAQAPQEVSLHRRRRTALLLTAALAVAAPLLTACGNEAHPGAAAVVGGQRITIAQLDNRVDEVREAQRAAVPDDAQYEQAIARTGSLTRDTLHSMVLDRVLERAAQDAGVTVTDREVQQLRTELQGQAGSAEALEAAWLQQYGIPPQRLDDNLRLQVTAQKLAEQLGTDTSRPEFWQALSAAGKKLDIDLNPRYGTWDPEKSSRVDATTPWVRDVTNAGAPQTA